MARTLVLSILAGIVALSVPDEARASGFAVRENCTEGLGMAFGGAGSMADNPCTVFNNPAGMTELKGTQFEVGITPAFPTVDFHGSLTSAAGTPLPGNDSGNGGRITAIPDLYAVTDLLPNLKGGIAITTPFGLPIKYNSQWYGRYNAIESQALSVDINPNLAYRVNDWLSVGGGVSAQYLRLTFAGALNQAPLGSSTDAGVRFKGDDWAVGYNFGVLIKPLPATRVGLTYRSKITHNLSGDEDFSNVSPLLSGVLVSGPAITDINVPATWGASVSHDFTEKLSLGLDVQYTQWSTFKTVTFNGPVVLSFNQSYQDSWFTALGASYKLTPTWTLRGGVGWDQSPVQNYYRTVAVPDQDRYMLGAGVGYAVNKRTSLDFAYAHYFASRASVNDSINSTIAGVIPPAGSQLHGYYQSSLDYLSLSVRLIF